MRENVIATQYSQDEEYRFEIIDMNNGTFQVWVQCKIRDDYMGEDWFGWVDIKDHIHITDTIERAHEIGAESLRNLTGT